MNLDIRITARPLLLAAALSVASLSLSACAPLIVGGAAAGTALVATDRRTTGTQVEDQNIAFKTESLVRQKFGDTVRVNAMVYSGQVLLTGDVPTPEVKSEAGTIAEGVENVKSVVNQLTVGPVASLSTRSNDIWLSSKVRTALLNTKYVPSGTIAVTTDHAVVYLMGKVTQAEGDYAATAASEVGGVARVVKLFETISREEAIRLSGAGTKSNAGESDPASGQTRAPIETAPAANDADTGVQAIPIK